MRRTEEKKEVKRKQRMKRKKKATKERRKTEKEGEGEHLTGNIYTVYELAGVSNRRGAPRRTRGRRGSREDEKAVHTKVKPLRFTGDFMA